MEKEYIKTGGVKMEELVMFFTQGSAEIDAFLIVRLVLVMMFMEFFTVVCGLLGGMKGR